MKWLLSSQRRIETKLLIAIASLFMLSSVFAEPNYVDADVIGDALLSDAKEQTIILYAKDEYGETYLALMQIRLGNTAVWFVGDGVKFTMTRASDGDAKNIERTAFNLIAKKLWN